MKPRATLSIFLSIAACLSSSACVIAYSEIDDTIVILCGVMLWIAIGCLVATLAIIADELDGSCDSQRHETDELPYTPYTIIR